MHAAGSAPEAGLSARPSLPEGYDLQLRGLVEARRSFLQAHARASLPPQAPTPSEQLSSVPSGR